MIEGKILAVAKNPMLSREVSEDYEFSKVQWDLFDNHESHGGSPVIVGLVTIQNATVAAKTTPRYKLEFPDGHIDYANVNLFDKFYDMEFPIQ